MPTLTAENARLSAENVELRSLVEHLEVARLVAEGLSNKEIGSRLFLSERTVETHVFKILNRLDINSPRRDRQLGNTGAETGLARHRLGGPRLHDAEERKTDDRGTAPHQAVPQHHSGR
jgi:DNA-binding NarL/FixJ family response regulator